jgi:hypothetical protein
MQRARILAALALAAVIALGPSLAAARAGGGYRMGGGGVFMNQGSLGSHTYDMPMQRSLTPQAGPAATGGLSTGLPPGYGASHPFMTGLAGGVFGGWLGSMLFPHWGMGYGGGFGGGFGSIFIWLLLGWGLWMGFRTLGGGRLAGTTYPGGPGMLMPGGLVSPYARAPARGAPLAIAHDDYQAFETILKEVQGAWSKGDLAALRPCTTPEMLSYFAEELAENQSQGVVNHVEQIELMRGDLREAWDEGRLHYASCYLQWRALDYTMRADRKPGDADAIVEGDAHQPSLAAEVWTFARSPGGRWLLSAIQQV